ncbi:unnamed protein product [Lathyrus oleraceus]|uniref:Nod-factor receptor 5 n=1 Tax=Pisum sativum TaxID=3888 RepID=A0A9D4XG32_PEA|nr:serine/threonine receptor-like kinase NFP [Pisum sativum]KAI5418255.1 hypothetical protein KIW84_042761 [Pisum sativum]
MVSYFIPFHSLFLALLFFSAKGTNFSRPMNFSLSYDTYVAYFARFPNFLTLTTISDIFDTTPQSIARTSNIKDENMNLVPGQLLLIPITCGCNGNGNYSFANISHLIKQGESYYYLSTISYQNLTNWITVEDSNPNLNPYLLTVGTKIVIPLFCRCPSKEIEYLITYVWQPNDNLTLVASKFGASQHDIITANANNFGQNFTAATNLPVFIPVKSLPAISQLHYSSSGRKKNNHFPIIIFIGTCLGCTILISLSLLVYVYCLRKRKACESKCAPSMEITDKLISEVSNYVSKPKVYQVGTIMEATMNFNEQCRIGKSVYKAKIDGHVLAVKNVKEEITVTEELMILQKVNHANLVKLIGVSSGYVGNHFLVYEYAENGSLYNWLFSEFSTASSSEAILTWNQRLNIAIDVAIGLQYMHEHTEPSIVHRDITSSNILLDSNFKAKISNFSVARTTKNPMITKVDVFAYGVVLLELLTGKKFLSENSEVDMLWKDIKGVFDIEEKREERVRRWMDPKLGSFFNVVEALSLLSLAVNCIKEQSLLRPTMGEVVLSLSLLTQHSPTLLERSCTYGSDVEVITGMVTSIIAR